MKAEFLRHEYTWSKKSVGGTVGLGIVSSTTPKETEQIRELEKMASMAEADSKTGMEVELLTYNSMTGFVKMAVKPVAAGEDQRKNKKVFLYQCVDKTTLDPEVYCLPKGSWSPSKGEPLDSVILENEWDSSKNIFMKYQCADRLPDFFRAVFWCVFTGTKNMAFVSKWPRGIYSSNTRELMYAVHKILPKNLRQNAGYASLGCGTNQYSSFYFTDCVPEDNYYNIETKELVSSSLMEDSLDRFFYDTLALLYWEHEGLYQQFVEIMEETIARSSIDKNILRDIQWIFLHFCIQNMMDIPKFEKIRDLCPQLFYRAHDSEHLTEVQDNLMEYYHLGKWSREDYEKYLQILEDGYSVKGEDQILKEMNWAINQYHKRYKNICKDYLEQLKRNNVNLYTGIMTRFFEEKNSVAWKAFQNSLHGMNSMKVYMNDLEQKKISENMKDAWMLRGIEILNKDIFDVEEFETFTKIASFLNRKDQWIQILSGFLGQLSNRSDELDKDQKKSFEEIERLYLDLSGKEKEKQEDEKVETKMDNLTVQEEKNELYRTIEPHTEESHFLPFLLRGLPYGFLTGCTLFLLNYALVIGHWKISVGMAGMWLIMILNYSIERLEKRRTDGYRLWMAIGLCIVEGYIIQIIAWLFLPQAIRVYFFMGLGLVTVIIQLLQMIYIQSLKYHNEEEA